MRNRILKIIYPYKNKVILIMGIFTLAAIIAVIIPLLSKELMDKGFVSKRLYSIIIYTILIFVLVFIHQSLELLKEHLRTDIKAKITNDLYRQATDCLIKIKIDKIEGRTLRVYNDLDVDINSISSIADDSVFFVITQVFTMIGGIIGLFIISYKLAIIALILIPIKYLFIRFFSNIREKSVQKMIISKSALASWFDNFLNGLKDIRILDLYTSVITNFKTKSTEYVYNNKKLEMITAYNSALDRIIIEAFNAIIYILGALLYLKNEITIGGVFSFVTYLVYISSPISAIMNLRFMIAGIIPSIKRYYTFLDLPKETSGNILSDYNYAKSSIIEFQNVSFSYTNNLNDLQIKEFDLKIDAGTKVGIWGKNGSGKSTLVNLLLRFYEPTSGSILLNGIEISKLDIQNYRCMFSVVKQNIFLFDESLEYNIFLNKEPDKSLITSLNLQDLFVDRDTKYNPQANLSGGQKQKIAFARALYLDKPIFIFDEPTSSFDIESQRQFNQILSKQLKDKTILLISHNYDTLKCCDIIVKMEQGKIVEIISSDELFKSSNIN